MSLNEQHDTIKFPATHYVYIEKIGPFQDTAHKAWEEVTKAKAEIAKHNQVVGAFAMYKVEQSLYRAGFAIGAKAVDLPPGIQYTHFEGGPYIRFTLTGSYMQLPTACGRVFELVEKQGLKKTDQFCLEHYLNDPQTTKEDQLLTEILIPTVPSAVTAK